MPIDINIFNALKDSTGEDFIVELVDTFLDDAPNLIEQMTAALASKEVDSFRRAAHSMKSNSATCGAMNLSALAKELEGMAKENNLDVGGRLDALKAEYESAAEELKKLK